MGKMPVNIRKMYDERLARIVAYRKGGLSIKQIADMEGIGTARVYQLLQAAKAQEAK